MFGTSGQLIIKPNMIELKKDRDLIFKAAPYCIFCFGSQKKITDHCKEGGEKNPLWEEVLVFERTTEETLTVQLWDREHINPDDFICEGTINITHLLKSGAQSVYMDLYKKCEFFGKLFMETDFTSSSKIVELTGPLYSESNHLYVNNKF